MSDRSRRRFVAQLTGAGAAAPALLFPGVLWAKVQESDGGDVTPALVLDAARVAGLEVTPEQAEAMVEDVERSLSRSRELRDARIGNEVPLPLHFDPRVPGVEPVTEPGAARVRPSSAERPADLEEVAFWPVTDLAHLIATRQVAPSELTDMYLRRLKRHGETLNCVVTLTEERARAGAREADEEIAAGRWRGPLHGIPYGVKDIIAARGYATTWGAAAFADRVIDEDATVIERLDAAGAVLAAKLTTGELAFGDRWFGGLTRSPWNTEAGSSGSSAGSGAATAAGLVGFSIGTDTGGSILAPSERCGVVGLRPTFGRVSRHGVMAAGTTLDKVGPMCRSAEDAALVLHAIAGPDDRDLSVADVPFHWDGERDATALRVGFLASAFESEEDPEYRGNHALVLELLGSRWGELRPVSLPASNINFFVEFVERAAGFDSLLREGLEERLVRPEHADELRAFHLVPAVAYLQANRLRQRLMEETHRALSDVDVVVSPHGVWWHPSRSANALLSLTGHPSVSVPTGLRANGQPLAVTLSGRLYREADLLAVAQRLLDATGFAEERPPLFS